MDYLDCQSLDQQVIGFGGIMGVSDSGHKKAVKSTMASHQWLQQLPLEF